MVIQTGNRQAYENFRGGKGTIYITWFVEDMPYNGSPLRKIALVEVPPGASVGFHVHEGTEEVYYVLSGKAKYIDGDKEVVITGGTITITPEGTGHGVENIGEDTLKLLAVINEVKRG
ncbi:cupin domain-containing protein [bacterium 3DAC]|nr:cupin domain-containing protein [Dictyoglomota bacterium]UZN23635.1 cupin domain-containing protein [bacterium 3DAC]